MNNKSMNENKTEMKLMNVEKREAYALSFYKTSDWNKGLCEFGRKLFRTAELLSQGEYLGLELAVDDAGNCCGVVFSTAKEDVTLQDCRWFFQGIAEIAETDQETGKLFGEQDFVYRLCGVSDSELEKDTVLRQKISEQKEADLRRKGQDQDDFVEMLQKTGLRLFILFGANGTEFLVSMGSRLSLGMRSLLGFIFPGTRVEEMSVPTCVKEGMVLSKEGTALSNEGMALSKEGTALSEEGTALSKGGTMLPQGAVLDMTASLLELFARKQYEKNRQDDYWNDSDDYEYMDDADGFEVMDSDDFSSDLDDCELADDADDFVPIGETENSDSQEQSDSGMEGEETLENSDTQTTYGMRDDMSIDELELSVRSFNCLKRANINTIGELRLMTDEDLMHVRNLGRKCICEIRERLAKYHVEAQSRILVSSEKGSFEQLDELIGLNAVKEQVRKIAAYAKMKRDMEERFFGNVTPIVLNMEFVGNPGTAKTTVARILAGILHEVGLLQYADIVEVGRADLVAKYVGQTADRVKGAFSRARGRVLFIDEAYSLLEDQEGSFGDEAIATIVQEMENNRKDTVVIFAGYPKEMENFISRNPGLRSRVPFRIEFQDYSAEEMTQIAEHEATQRGFQIDPDAKEKVLSICKENSGNKELGNGRFSRNLVERAILNYAARVYGTDCGKLSDAAKNDAEAVEEKQAVMMENAETGRDGRAAVTENVEACKDKQAAVEAGSAETGRERSVCEESDAEVRRIKGTGSAEPGEKEQCLEMQRDFILRPEDFIVQDFQVKKEGIRPLGFAV